MLVINDTHLGARRQAGTTPESQQALTEFQRQEFRNLLDLTDGDLVINGDLFDSFTVDPVDVVFAYEALSDFIFNGNQHMTLTLVCGNHDHSPRGNKLSSFHMLCHFLQARWPFNVKVVDYSNGLTYIATDVLAIPHMPNQELFDLEIEKLDDEKPGVLLLHANYDNNFAEHSDHSLNVSEDVAKDLVAKGWTLLFGHEHQMRTALNGKVLITGNQIPTSVADCLGTDNKYVARIHDGKVELGSILTLSEIYSAIDWRNLSDVNPDAKFVRVSGEASAEEAAEVVNAVSNLRKSHKAFVISNAVSISGLQEFDELSSVSFEDVSKVDVLGLICEDLTDREAKVVKELLG